MHVTIEFSKSLSERSEALIFPAFKKDGEIFIPGLKAISKKSQNEIKRILELTQISIFSAKKNQILSLFLPQGCSESTHQIILFGAGEINAWDANAAENLGGGLSVKLSSLGHQGFVLMGEGLAHCERILFGFSMRSYQFIKHKTSSDSQEKSIILTYFAADVDMVKEAYKPLASVFDGVVLARDLTNEAPNILYPESYAQLIKDELKPLGVEIEILDEKKMLKLGMGGIMAVGQGSVRQPRMVIMRWNGASASKSDKPVALVGKGVTFDTGGISIKPSAGMDEMKMDMGGSAAVVGAMKAIALQKTQANVVAIVGLAENMPSANAYRPGDIITTYAGKTVEVLNTDAEGRLVLADALSYVQDKYNPSAVVDLATLTGAIVVAIGHEYCGTFTDSDALWNELNEASKIGHEKLWRMPLDEVWAKEVVSSVADLRNIGKSRFAGSSTAAEFLHHFIDEGRKWAHMDIAGTAMLKSDKPIVPKGGSGFAVRTLVEWVSKFYAA